MVRRLIRLKGEIRAQAQELELQRLALSNSFNRLKAHYRSRLASPAVLVTALISGLAAGTLLRRGRRGRHSSWLKLGRAIVSPALIYLLRTRAAHWMHKVGL